MKNLIENALVEAAPINRDDLDKENLKTVKFLEKTVGGSAMGFFDGMSGMVVDIRLKNEARLGSDILVKISKKVRWMEVGRPKEVSFGF